MRFASVEGASAYRRLKYCAIKGKAKGWSGCSCQTSLQWSRARAQQAARRIGRRHEYVLALSADHGVCPLVEVSRAKGRDAARVQPMSGTKTEAFLVEQFGKRPTKWLEAISGPWVSVHEKTANEAKVPVAEVERALAGYYETLPGVAEAFTRSQFAAPAIAGENPFLPAVRQSYFSGRCGDVYVLLKPYHLPSAALGTGTTHGTPYEYDTHVPLIVFGAGVKPGIRTDRVAPLAAGPILAKAAGVPLPTATTPVPNDLWLK